MFAVQDESETKVYLPTNKTSFYLIVKAVDQGPVYAHMSSEPKLTDRLGSNPALRTIAKLPPPIGEPSSSLNIEWLKMKNKKLELISEKTSNFVQ